MYFSFSFSLKAFITVISLFIFSACTETSQKNKYVQNVSDDNVQIISGGSLSKYTYTIRAVNYSIHNMNYKILELNKAGIVVINVTKDSLEVEKLKKESK